MADLKSFINTSSDRIKSAMGVPVDRIKTIQGSLLNQIPAHSLATLWLDGSIVKVGSDYYFVDKIAGNNVLITGYDFSTGWVKGFPYKSAATIDIFGETAVPVVSMFQNYNYGNQFFCKHKARVLHATLGYELFDACVMEIVAYSQPLTGDDLVKANTYFGVPQEVTSNVRYVDFTNGNDSTGTGTKANPWKTLVKANASATIGDTVYVKSGSLLTTISHITKRLNFIGLGKCELKADTGAGYVIYNGANTTFTGFILNGNQIPTYGVYGYYGAIISTLTRCLLYNEYQVLVNEGGTGSTTYIDCVFIARIANTKADIISNSCTNSVWRFEGCYIKDANIYTSTAVTTSTFTNCRGDNARTNRAVILARSTNNVIFGGSIDYAYIGISGTKSDIQYVKFNPSSTSASVNRAIVGTNITVKYCQFIDDLSTADNRHFIYLEDPTIWDIEHNYFRSATKNIYIHVRIQTHTVAITSGKINYNYSKSNSFPGAIYTTNLETAYSDINDNAEFIGNRIIGHRFDYPDDNTSGVHAILANGGKNMKIAYNHITHCHLGIVAKNGTAGTAYTTEGIKYNVIQECVIGMIIRGIKGLNIFGNTITHSSKVYGYNAQAGISYISNGGTIWGENGILKNNIIDIKLAGVPLINIDQHHADNGFVAEYNRLNGNACNLLQIVDNTTYAILTAYTDLATANAAGKLLHSEIGDPDLNTDGIPSEAITGGEDLGAVYDDALDINSVWKSIDSDGNIITEEQGEVWQKGAYII